jgi:long-chain acyl-CoA synthetase
MPDLQVEKKELVLERVYRWEKELANQVYMTQPMGGGKIRTYTWAEALGEARRMAAHLASFNFPPRSNIAILSKNCAHFMMSDLAIWMAGHISVALYPTLNAETVRFILEHSEAKLIFVGKLDSWEEMKPGVPEIPRISYALSPPNDYPVWEDIVARTAPMEGDIARDPDETSILIYTSGSTGKPKGVEHTFRTMSVAAKGLQQVTRLSQEDRHISYLPLAHAFERTAVEALSFYAASQVFFADSLDTFVQDLQRARPTLFHSVPRLWLKFQHGVFKKMPEKKLKTFMRIPILSGIVKKKLLKGLGLDATRIAVSGSAPISPELLQWYRDLGLELLEGYAMSENFSYSHLSLPGRSRVGYVGHNLPGVDTKLSEAKEVLVKSPATMKGYYKEPQMTAESFTADGYLKTGDQGEIDADGRLKITGRVKELFKTSKGKYIAPVPIENLINADSHIEQSCVMGASQPQPFAAVMLNEELRKTIGMPGVKEKAEQALQSLINTVNAQLNEHEKLEFLVVVKEPWVIENGYLTPSMKIKRNVIEKAAEPNVEGWYQARRKVIWE